MDLQTMLHNAMMSNKQNRIQLMEQEQARYAPPKEETLQEQMLAEVLGQQVRHQIAGLPSQQSGVAPQVALPAPSAAPAVGQAPAPAAPAFDFGSLDLGGALQSVGNIAAAVPNGPTDLLSMLAAAIASQGQGQPAPQAAPVQSAPQAAPVQDTMRPQVPMPEAPPVGALPANATDILTALQGAGQTDLPGSLESALGGESVTPAEPGFFDKFKAFIGDPAVSRMLLQAGASMDNGGTLAMGLNDGMKVYDQVRQTQAAAPYEARKRELELKKSSSEIGKIISEAGKNAQDGFKAGQEGAMVGYNAETDRIKANAAKAQAQASMKQAEIESSKLIKSLEKDDVLDDKSYATLFAGTLEAVNNNPMLTPILQERGLDTAEYSSWLLNSPIADSNKKYLPLAPSKAQGMRAEYEQLTAAPDSPETKVAIDKWRDKMKSYVEIYGRDALVPIINQQGK